MRVMYIGEKEDIEDDEYEEALRRLKEFGKCRNGRSKTSHGINKIKMPCLDKGRPTHDTGGYRQISLFGYQ